MDELDLRRRAAPAGTALEVCDIALVDLTFRVDPFIAPIEAFVECATISHSVDVDGIEFVVRAAVHGREVPADVDDSDPPDDAVEDQAADDEEGPFDFTDSFLHLNAEWEVRFEYRHGPVDLDEDTIDAFGRTTVVFAAYPYVRELVQSLTSRAGIPPLLLDLYRLPLSPAGSRSKPVTE